MKSFDISHLNILSLIIGMDKTKWYDLKMVHFDRTFPILRAMPSWRQSDLRKLYFNYHQMNWREKQQHKIVRTFAHTCFNKIEVKAGECLYNFRCHRNVVHFAKKKKHNRVAMVLYDNWTYINIHFINVYNSKKKWNYFVDNTIWEWCSEYDYYFIRWIMEDDFMNIDDIFWDIRVELTRLFPFYLWKYEN